MFACRNCSSEVLCSFIQQIKWVFHGQSVLLNEQKVKYEQLNGPVWRMIGNGLNFDQLVRYAVVIIMMENTRIVIGAMNESKRFLH